ncbi:carbohydrate-binding protein [Aquimarina sp. ERC-38]|uniref:carbohydrate-binding protein n=1 Tax=Aquimarina sp. ERC-38 TaxID=2949996 RepID=UPI002246A6F5|nr:carbohydrate-binding protein [Aquimarina sp. ERC-38]UZO80141.1 carbohydrate-binding protein [Aquimarina sp. ERC-38]
MKKFLITLFLLGITFVQAQNQSYSGVVLDKNTNSPIANASVVLVETNQTTTTNSAGAFSITVNSNATRTLQIDRNGYMFEDLRNLAPDSNLSIALRPKIKSVATLRWERYINDCKDYNNPNVPDDPVWNMEWTESNITGTLKRDAKFTRRDPTAVIKHNNKFYVWYTYKLTEPSTWFRGDANLDGDTNVFPWDNADIYYATSEDGFKWDEQGPAVTRGVRGRFDDQSVFTPEIFVHQSKFYLVYQTVQWPYIERVKNNVAMAVADSPDGPWVKLDEPILRATDNGKWADGSTSRIDATVKGDFDSHKVHDPCLMFYDNKFYLYYKGERMGEERYCGEREIRWGVAIADKPTGPYIKSQYNPITTSGHEVAVWNYDGGMAIINKLDGPERGTVLFAEDGLNFELKGKVKDVPEALGIFRPGNEGTSPKDGVQWGLAHRYDWPSVKGGSNFLVRFDIVQTPEDDKNFIIEAETFVSTNGTYDDSEFGGPGFGMNKSSVGTNFVNAGDNAEYTITIPETGDYKLTYEVATLSEAAQVQFEIDNVSLALTNIPSSGGWDTYQKVTHDNTVNLTAGQHRLRITASGSSIWQWNLDKIILAPVSTTLSTVSFLKDSTNDINIYPNPTTDLLTIANVGKEVDYTIYNLEGVALTTGKISNTKNTIAVSQLTTGLYIVTLTNNGDSISSSFVKK